jgi:hypothetical protein
MEDLQMRVSELRRTSPVPGALASLRWQFELISPNIELFASAGSSLFHL